MSGTMRGKLGFIVSLTFLQAAAAPPNECPQATVPGQTLPMAVDLAGHPRGPSDLAAQSFAAAPSAENSGPCHNALQAAAPKAGTLQDEPGDVLHGLPAPDLLRPLSEVHQRPEYR